ncbi:MAG: hypothetical protein K6G90_13170 [Clostridia bacterium]|nr:hypothetical protein [Clostridia bacterium]
MRNFLRKCAVILIAVFLLTALPALSATAEEDGPELVVTFDAADLDGNYPITVKFINAWGIDAANVTLEFDPAVITPVAADEYEDVDEYYGCVSNIKEDCVKFAFMCVDDDGFTDDEELILGSPLFTLADEALAADYIEVTATVTAFMCNDVVYTAEQRAAMSDVQRLPIHHYGEPDYQFSNDYSTCTAMMVCVDEVCNHHIQAETVDTNYVVRGNPDCNAGGRIWYTADFTKDGFEHQEISVQIDKIGHTGGEPVVDPESVVPATCLTDGSHDMVSYCVRCNTEVSREHVIDPATGHTPAEEVRENEVPSQCLVAGSYDTVVYCETCGAELERETITTEPLQHRYIIPVDRIEPTCTEQGYTVYKCYRCGDTINDDFVDAAGHTPLEAVTENNTAAACLTDGGYDTVVYCGTCGEELSRDHTVVPANGHTPAAAVTENQIAATCTANGSYDSVVYCSACGTELSRAQNIVNASGHAYGAWTPVDDDTHKRVCSNDASHVETAAHEWNDGEITAPPSVTSTGIKTYTCGVCGATREESIPKLVEPLDDSRVTLSAATFVYSNAVQKPTVTVKNSAGTGLTEGVDYTVEFSSGCKDPGTYTVTVTGNGNYSGTVTKTFTITKQPLNDSRVTLSADTFAYNSAVQKPTVTVKNAAGVKLTEGTSYTVEFSAGCKDPGTYTVTVTGKGKFSGSVTKTFTITRQPLNDSRVTLSADTFTYNSAVQKPTVTVKNAAGVKLTEGTSYTVEFSAGCKAPGTYTVTVTGKGKFSGSVTKTFTITRQPLNDSRVTLSADTFTYNSAVQKPAITVKNAAGTKLTEGTSYTLAYSGDCKNSGTYTVTVTGKGSFTGTVTKTFTINKQPLNASLITLSADTLTYNSAEQKPTITVKNAAGLRLTEGTSYTVEYSSGCKDPGTYTVTVTAKGNYSGTAAKTFTINKQPLKASLVTLSADSFTYNSAVQKPTITVKNAAGLRLTEGTSYTVEFSAGCKDPGTYTVTVTGMGKYSGSVTKTFAIVS